MASVAKPSTCCGKGGESCVCAQNATCSCGKQPALSCTCDKAATENVKPAGSTCACGLRPAGACTCDKTGATGGSNSANEIDFTTKK